MIHIKCQLQLVHEWILNEAHLETICLGLLKERHTLKEEEWMRLILLRSYFLSIGTSGTICLGLLKEQGRMNASYFYYLYGYNLLPVNNILVKSWNTYWLIDWLIDWLNAPTSLGCARAIFITLHFEVFDKIIWQTQISRFLQHGETTSKW